METIENSTKDNIFNKIFTYDEDMKYDSINLFQFILFSIIPIVLLSKFIENYSPDINNNKPTIELLLEIILQINVLFIGFYLIQHIVINIPTFSGKKYPEMFIVASIIPVLFSIISTDNQLNIKINILFSRFTNLWNGTSENNIPQEKNIQTQIKVSQPLSSSYSQNQMFNDTTFQNNSLNISQQSSSTNGTSLINELPTNPVNSPTLQQNYPDYNSMYQKNPTPLIDANTPGNISNEGFIEPANSFLGGNFGSSF